ncbi:SGNH hydrolase domain-containing protein [Leucobacter sp. GX24907]
MKAAPDDVSTIYDTSCYAQRDSAELYADPAECVLTHPDSDFSVYLVGDSHAAQWVPTVTPIAQEHGWKLTFIGKRSCPIQAANPDEVDVSTYPSCIEWRENLEKELLAQQPDAIISGMYNNSKGLNEFFGVDELQTGSPEEASIAEGLVRAWKPLLKNGTQVVAIVDNPRLQEKGPKCLAENLAAPEACFITFSEGVTDRPQPELLAAEQLPEVDLVDLNDSICRDDKCYASDAATVIYRDKHHLTETFAAQLQGEFARQLKSVPLFAEHMQ